MTGRAKIFAKSFAAGAHLLNSFLLQSSDELLVGGQAVIEGVMMRSPNAYAIAVRKPAWGAGAEPTVVVKKACVRRIADRFRIFKWPVVRGVGILGQAFVLGMKAIKFSADEAMDVIEKEAAARTQQSKPQSELLSRKPKNSAKKSELGKWFILANGILATALFIFLFKFLPLTAATFSKEHWGVGENDIVFSLVDGFARLTLFVAYIGGLCLWRDFRRLYEYHGAEHKVVFNFESGRPLSIENARPFSTLHPRCGTSFLLTVMLVSVFVYAFIPFHSFAMKLLSRIILLPVIMGLSYEIIRFAARKPGSLFAAMTAPGLWLQTITTRPPSDDQLEIGIRALQESLTLEHSFSAPKG